MKATGNIKGKFPDGRPFKVLAGKEIPEEVVKFMDLKESSKATEKKDK